MTTKRTVSSHESPHSEVGSPSLPTAGRFGVRAWQGESGERGLLLVYSARSADALAIVPASALAVVRVMVFLLSLYLLYSLTFVLAALPVRSSTLARLWARARYVRWQWEHRAVARASTDRTV